MLVKTAAGWRRIATLKRRGKITALEEAFAGHFTDHHAFLLVKMINADIADLDTRDPGDDRPVKPGSGPACNPAPPRSAGRCRAPANSPIFGLAEGRRLTPSLTTR